MQQNQNPNKVAATEAPRRVISLLVDNHNGVLARVSSLFGRRGFNIDSLTVSATTDPAISRRSIIVTGDGATRGQIMKQLAKLEEVMHVVHLEEDSSCCSELVFVKLHTPDVSVRSDIRQLCDLYGARVVDTQESEIIIELSEVPSRIDAFLDVISNFKILEMSRSGVTAIEK